MTDSSPSKLDELVPPALADRIHSYHSAGPAWLRDLPELIASCVDRWDLTLFPAFDPGGDSSWTAPVRRRTGDLAVLQLSVPTQVCRGVVGSRRDLRACPVASGSAT